MPGLVTQLRLLHQSPSGKRILRYAMVSAICVPVYFLALFLVYGVLRLWTEIPSTIFANVVAGVPSYFLYRHWVWGRSGRSHLLGEVVPFWVVSGIGVLLTIVTAAKTRQLGIEHHFDHELRTAVLLGASFLAFGTLWVIKYFIFHRLFHSDANRNWINAEVR
jgi:putative flippase GtrA